jgi:hypothetical protein
MGGKRGKKNKAPQDSQPQLQVPIADPKIISKVDPLPFTQTTFFTDKSMLIATYIKLYTEEGDSRDKKREEKRVLEDMKDNER